MDNRIGRFNSLEKCIAVVALMFSIAVSPSLASTSSETYELAFGEFTQGGGGRSSENHVIQHDQLRLSTGGVSTSPEYELQAGFVYSDTVSGSAPSGTVETDYYTNSTSITLALTCQDPDGCSRMQFSNDNINWSDPEPSASSKTWGLPVGDEKKNVFVRFEDHLGNWSQVYPIAVVLDTVIPTVTISPSGGLYSTSRMITVTASEGTVYYTTDGTAATTSSRVYSNPFALAEDSIVNVLVVDRAGNEKTASETYSFCLNSDGSYCAGRSANFQLAYTSLTHGGDAAYSSNFTVSRGILPVQPVQGTLNGQYVSESNSLDHSYSIQTGLLDDDEATLPSCGVFINGGRTITNDSQVELGLICSDDSGCSEVAISNNGISWPSTYPYLRPYATSTAWDLGENDGEKRVFVKFKNGNGQGVWSGVCSASIILDTKGPAATASLTSGTSLSSQQVTLTSSETGAIYYSLDPNAPTTAFALYTGPITISSNDTVLRFFAVDAAGNSGAVKTENYTTCNGSNFTVQGTVRDATVKDANGINKPVPWAIITLNSGTSVNGNGDGFYQISGLSKGYYTIESVKVQTPGYVTYQKPIMLCNQNPALIVQDILLTKTDTVFGSDSNSGYSWGSVNTSTGNYVYDSSDLVIPGRGMSFAFERTYNSQDQSDGPLGRGWTHTYNISMSEANGDITVRWGNGKTESWSPDGSGGYVPRYGVFNTLTRHGDGTFTVRQKNMTEYNFNTARKLTSIVDENGNTITLGYTGDSATEFTDTVGRRIEFSYDVNGLITRILDPTGLRSVTFTYDIDHNLVSSTGLDRGTTTYSYDDKHRMLTLTDPRGNTTLTNTYDSERDVVISQKDALGGETLYSYDTANRVTQIIDPYGNSSYHYFDDLLRLTREEDARGNSAHYTYNDRGSIETAKDKNGNTTTYTYDANGNVTLKEEPLGKKTSAEYDANNNPIWKTDANGYVTGHKTYYEYSTDGKGNLLKVTDTLGSATEYTYDSYGQVETVTDAAGGITRHQYDIYGNKVTTVDAGGNTHSFDYDYIGRKVAEHHPLGRATAYEYDNADRLLSITDALGGTSSFVYDANGNKTEHKDARGKKTFFVYDVKNRLITKAAPGGERETYTYDLMDRRDSVKNPRGYVTNLGYDAMGNVIHEIDAMGNHVQHEYDFNGNRTKTTDAMGNVTIWAYDALNRLETKTDPLGGIERYTYDLNGNRLTLTDPSGRTTRSTYDELSRLKTVKDSLDNMTVNDYDELGRLKKVTDARNNQTRFEYDALGRMVKVTDAANGVVTAEYDEVGNRVSVTDTLGQATGKKTSYTYDILNRLSTETDPSGNRKAIYYDAIGNMISLIDSDGETNFEYDDNNRVVEARYPSGTPAAYAYDANGNRTSVTDVMGTTMYTYDALDRISSVSDPYGKAVSYTYAPNGNRTSIRYPGNRPVFYYYDEQNRLTTVEDWGGAATSYEYDEAGRLKAQTMGNGAKVSYTYDNAGRLTDKGDKTASGTVIAGYHYTLDGVGNRTGMTMTQPIVPRVNAIDRAFTHDNGGRVVSSNSGSITYEYDGKGNRTARVEGTATTQYAYDFRNRLTRITNGGGVDEYRYNSDGKRLSSVQAGVETRYLLDLNGSMENILAEMAADADSTVRKYYVYGDGLLYSVDAATGERLYYHYDPLGSTVAMTDSNGNITDKYAYLPFGELNRSESLHDNRFTYVGKYGVIYEPNGLYFMRARFYDPETRRFMSVDPVKGDIGGTQSLGMYGYAENNPLLMVDPQGTFATMLKNLLEIGAKGLEAAVLDDKNQNETASYWNYVDFGIGLIPGVGDIYQGGKETLGFAKGIWKGITYDDFDRDGGGGYTIGYTLGVILNPETISYWSERTISQTRDAIDMYKTLKSIKSIDSVCRAETREVLKVTAGDSSTTSTPETKSTKIALSDTGTGKSGTASKDPPVKSAVEQRIEDEQKARKAKAKARAKARARAEAERERQRQLYEAHMISQSKYSVLVYDLSKLPTFNSGNRSRGVYGKK